jgi:hypothetical protein
MFTFVIWAIGISIMTSMAWLNMSIIATAFAKHWLLGILCLLFSLVGWTILLTAILFFEAFSK